MRPPAEARWTSGDFDGLVRARLRQLRALGVGLRPDAWGLELGCGPGVSALALARLGLQVVAVDSCRAALAELGAHDSTCSVEVVRADVVEFVAGNTRRFDVILCLGDVLPRLASPGRVERLLRHLPRTLRPGGRVLLAFSDEGREPSLRGATASRIDPSRVARVLREVGLEPSRWDPGTAQAGWIGRRPA
jgi:2-polyprenyl-3-methyl-5-hydroxy-6-metoxy-1,4-benzoquinol methylase